MSRQSCVFPPLGGIHAAAGSGNGGDAGSSQENQPTMQTSTHTPTRRHSHTYPPIKVTRFPGETPHEAVLRHRLWTGWTGPVMV
jgi:hypothetical protein